MGEISSIRKIDNAYILIEDTIIGKRETAISLKQLKEIINNLEEE